MRRVLLPGILALCLGGAAVSEEDPARLARQAAEALGEAAEGLAEAERSPDRIRALTETIRAYEMGLAAMRDGLRRAALAEGDLAGRLAEQDAELGSVLSSLQKVARGKQAQSFVYPGSAADTIRAGMLASALVPALEERSEVLAADLSDLAALRAVQQAGIATLEDGLHQVREARLSLTRAISDRTDLPPLAATDEAAMEALINSSETLAAFADTLSAGGGPPEAEAPDWQMPVIGKMILGFEEADAGDVRRPGWTIATTPEALVTSPAEASVRFSGEAPGSGPVVILETSPGTLAILAGLGKSLVKRGQVVSAGEPVGLMGAGMTPPQEKLNETSLLGGQPGSETLYIEIRQGQAPVDPAAFLRPREE
jgi:septal ring factor EnvC (AmiA/AmiB activator)